MAPLLRLPRSGVVRQRHDKSRARERSERGMRAHVVFAHPEPKSFCAAMKDTTMTALAEAGYVITISDLYAEHFNPVASAADFVVRRDSGYLSYALEQRHAIEWHMLAPDIAREVERTLAADLLILIFPVFWFSMPAIPEGLDRPGLSVWTVLWRSPLLWPRSDGRATSCSRSVYGGARPHVRRARGAR
jgi:Flavodoxin-like fold